MRQGRAAAEASSSKGRFKVAFMIIIAKHKLMLWLKEKITTSHFLAAEIPR